ncbi:MAG: hypothetical protein GX958_10010 [Desulfitobacterium sp.]|nr:hypothetical protein [Desulfitobacterium sp.]
MNHRVTLDLHFGKEDEEIWQILKKFPQEEWEEIIKEALRLWGAEQGIRGENLEVEGDSHDWDEQLKSSDEDKITVAGKSTASSKVSWSLEDLFSSHLQEPRQEPEFSLESKPDPLRHLFALIGEEEDEEVIDFLRGKPSSKTEEKENKEDKKDKEDTDENNQPNPSVLSTTADFTTNRGLNYILQNVIGEEDDPEVLKYFKSQKEE